MKKKLTDLHRSHLSATAALVRYRGALRRLRPTRLDADAQAHLEELKQSNEGVLRLVSNSAENDRLFRDIRREQQEVRTQAAAVARHHAREVRHLAREARERIAAEKRNVRPMFADALDGMSKGDMVSLELLRLQLQRLLTRASAGQLLTTYRSALGRRDDPRALLEVEIIEELAADAALASGPEDLPVVKELRQHITDVEMLRIPPDWPDFDQLEHEADRLDARADLLRVLAIDPGSDADAGEAYQLQQAELEAAGQASDVDDQRNLREAQAS